MTAFTWRSASATSQGNVRPHTEDAVLELPAVGLWVVADGMGGHAAGEVEAAHDDALLVVEGTGWFGAEPAGDHSVRADVAADRSDALLGQLIDRALAVTECREESAFAFEYHSEICW